MAVDRRLVTAEELFAVSTPTPRSARGRSTTTSCALSTFGETLHDRRDGDRTSRTPAALGDRPDSLAGRSDAGRPVGPRPTTSRVGSASSPSRPRRFVGPIARLAIDRAHADAGVADPSGGLAEQPRGSLRVALGCRDVRQADERRNDAAPIAVPLPQPEALSEARGGGGEVPAATAQVSEVVLHLGDSPTVTELVHQAQRLV